MSLINYTKTIQSNMTFLRREWNKRLPEQFKDFIIKDSYFLIENAQYKDYEGLLFSKIKLIDFLDNLRYIDSSWFGSVSSFVRKYTLKKNEKITNAMYVFLGE